MTIKEIKSKIEDSQNKITELEKQKAISESKLETLEIELSEMSDEVLAIVGSLQESEIQEYLEDLENQILKQEEKLQTQQGE